jgi:hypothetical protein
MSKADASLESSASSAKQTNSASEKLLIDAQDFKLNLGTYGALKGNYSSDNFIEIPQLVNEKLNQVNNMSASDRKTWITDFEKANNDPNLAVADHDVSDSPVGLSIQTGSNGKADSFEISTSNFDKNGLAANGTLDGNVGANGSLNVHVDSQNTSAQFVANQISGLESPIKPIEKNEAPVWAAETSAMPASWQASMIQAGKSALPDVTWNTNAQGELTSLTFSGQESGPDQWNTTLKSNVDLFAGTTEYLADTLRQNIYPNETNNQPKYEVVNEPDTSAPAGPPSGSDAGQAAGSSSYLPENTVVQGVGANPGLYITNGDGSMSALGQ